MEENKKNKEEQPTDLNQKNPKNKAPVFVAIFVLFIAVVIFFIWQNSQLEAERERQEKEIVATYLKLDSMSNELDEKIITIQGLGGDIDTLKALKEQLENDKKQLILKEKRNRKSIAQLNDRVEGYRKLLLLKDEEIKQLTEVNEQLADENSTLKVEKNQLNQSIRKLEANREELEGKVITASRLEISGMNVFAVNASGKERKGEFRNRHIDKLKIQFTVLENSIAPIEGKQLLLRVIAPDGNTLFDVIKGSGSFTYQGRELFYTAKQEILYDRNSQLITYFYDKGSDFALGQHKVEIYTDNYPIGSGSFIVK